MTKKNQQKWIIGKRQNEKQAEKNSMTKESQQKGQTV